MKIDYHIHLEEGPYNLKWWQQTAEAISYFQKKRLTKKESILHELNELHELHNLNWIKDIHKLMSLRLEKGAYNNFWSDLYLERALELGIKEVGIVDHLYRFCEAREYFEKYIDFQHQKFGAMQRDWLDAVCVTSIGKFVKFIEQEKEKWESYGVKLRLGIEADYFPQGEEELVNILGNYPWDFVIGSVHFIDGWGFDNPETSDYFQELDLEKLYDHFFQIVEMSIKSKIFDIIGHLDNLKVFGYRPAERFLIPYYEHIAKILKETDTTTELNTGLLYRYPVKEVCPAPHYLQILAKEQVLITTSSDAHFPHDVGTGLDIAKEILINAGYDSIISWEKRRRRKNLLSR